VYVDSPRPGRIYLPGSFNPLHDGHKEMLEASWGDLDAGDACFCCVLLL
jgi:phosphopantetheine adenylyltransferase